ncbi:amylo-alpha-1,6-glucosidase [Paenibacillus sp. KN14-4R]|uniref:amylo-alpha-1,6-glucosidase n=1 Tax=Paenibacillus sp. KN14-4R TaxID=3445773 RepID=UPI003FA098E5
MNFDLKRVPFSRYGSYFVISHLKEFDKYMEGCYLRIVRGGDNDIGAVFRIALTKDGQEIPFTYDATPTELALVTEHGKVRWCIAEPDRVHVQASGVGLKFYYESGAYDYAISMHDDHKRCWEVNSFSRDTRFKLAPITGDIEVDSQWLGLHSKHITLQCLPDPTTDDLEFSIEEYRAVPKKRDGYPSYEQSLAGVKAHYDEWVARTLSAPEPYEQARELAAYITWSCVVRADGYLPRDAMYMSKNWMTNIWSWDHCFNAMALIQTAPELAWDQFMIFFDRQDESGMLPDFMNDKTALWNCCKPPIHGWTLKWMMDRTSFLTDKQYREVYKPLAAWTKWWLNHRDDDRDGVPQYNHGNDCGWDNSTVFLTSIPVESPDLCAFLILQMDVLASLAHILEKEDEARQWRAEADHLLQRMLDHFWDGEKFTAMQSGTHAASIGDSLLLFMPIVLGERLPEDVRNHLIEGLKQSGRFLTENGLATESVSSPYYSSDGYWRGPIWAPSSMLLIDGLTRSGELEFAQNLAAKFCGMAARSGMAENYDAITGEGLRDPAFTWTSSVFLILANEWVQSK